MSFVTLLSNNKRAFQCTLSRTQALIGLNPHVSCRRHIQSGFIPDFNRFLVDPATDAKSKGKRRALGWKPTKKWRGLRRKKSEPKIKTAVEKSALQRPTRSMYFKKGFYDTLSTRLPERELLTMFDAETVADCGAEVRNFSQQTLQWIIGSTESHMRTHGDSYGFHADDVKLLSDDPNTNTLISSTAENTSQWLINRMLSLHHFVHTFTKSTDFQSLKNLFKIPDEVDPSVRDGIMTLRGDSSSDIRIEQTDVTQIGTEWMQHRGYNEYFDVIFDELPVDNVVSFGNDEIDDYVQTTIYGHCLKRGGVVYVSEKRISGDIAGRKLRSKMSALYPNSHFELIAERDTAWDTQFVFLKALSCLEENTDRQSDRKDEWGDSHLSYAQSAIWERSKVRDNAGRDVVEGMARITDAIERDANPHHQPKAQEAAWFSMFRE